MRYDQSYGIVPLRYDGASWFVFVVRHRGGHWTLPKGHPEGVESALECAKRELFEETGLTVVKLLFEPPLVESYQFSSRGKPIHKTVHYFIAEVEGTIVIQKEELQDGRWIELARAQDIVTYAQMKTLLNSVYEKLAWSK